MFIGAGKKNDRIFTICNCVETKSQESKGVQLSVVRPFIDFDLITPSSHCIDVGRIDVRGVAVRQLIGRQSAQNIRYNYINYYISFRYE